MIDYTDLDLIDSNMFLVGDTDNKRDWSEEGPQYECYDLTTLLHNIAVAGALTRAWKLGDDPGARWWPNNRGYVAP
jgi:hypothetical protein